MVNHAVFIMTNDYKRYYGTWNSKMKEFVLDDKNMYKLVDSNISVSMNNGIASCSKPFVFIWPVTNDRVERRRQNNILLTLFTVNRWTDFFTNFGTVATSIWYSWTYDFDKSNERNKEETMFEEKYLKVNDKCFKTQWIVNKDYKKFIKFCYGGGV